MKQTDIRMPVIAGMALGLAMMQAACVNTKPARPVPSPMAVATSVWQPLAEDKLHDPGNPGIKLLQEPGVALSTLSANKLRMSVGSFRTVGVVVNKDGNKVDWVQAVKDGIISPRRARTPPATGVEREELVMDMDMFLDIGGSMPIVRFPHLAHTMWLACSNCHPAIFVPQSGANPLSMERILSGEQCGICHRAVSFPPADCARCHSVGRESLGGIKVKAEAIEKAKAKAKVQTAVPPAESPLPILNNEQQFIPEQPAQQVPQLELEAQSVLPKIKSKRIPAPGKKIKPQQASAQLSGQDCWQRLSALNRIPIQEVSAQTSGQESADRALEMARLVAEINQGLDANQKLPRRKFIGARTQEQGYPQYIEDWRIKLERTGKLNYPKAARQKKMHGNLKLTVSICADGGLENVEVSRSSGQRVLDEAAQRIVRLAAPFVPLPPDIRKDVDILSITRTWTFTSSGRLKVSDTVAQ